MCVFPFSMSVTTAAELRVLVVVLISCEGILSCYEHMRLLGCSEWLLGHRFRAATVF